ncbi:MAG TPA: methyltransferase domain-containing protein [Acidimicrobiia bacterium]|nr:methyltransferase domain-containing protein [Acidimicrobiia bacterium]
MECRCPSDYEEVFSERAARATAARFRRRGLTGTSRTIVAQLTKMGVRGSVLEIGGGLGEIQVALLERGLADFATNVDLATNWEREAAALLDERGLQDRVTRVCGDFVQLAPTLPRSDLVILNRVVCCYPDWRALLTHACSRAATHLVFSFPRPWLRPILWIENLFHRVRGRRFRAFIHPAPEMMTLLDNAGFRPIADHRSSVWRTTLVERQPPDHQAT